MWTKKNFLMVFIQFQLPILAILATFAAHGPAAFTTFWYFIGTSLLSNVLTYLKLFSILIKEKCFYLNRFESFLKKFILKKLKIINFGLPELY